jgi:hypothetical protein
MKTGKKETECELDSSGSGYSQIPGSCERGDKILTAEYFLTD